MNEIDVRAIPTRGQFAAQFRRVHKADYETVQENGEPILFPSAEKAEVAGWRALTCHINTIMRRDGEIVKLEARAKAEALFKRGNDGLVCNQNEARVTVASS